MVSIQFIDDLVSEVATTKAVIEVNNDFYEMLKKLIYHTKKEIFEDISEMKDSLSKQFRDSFEFEMLKMKHLGDGVKKK